MSKTKMPSVQGAKGSKPTLTFPGTEAPEGLHVQLLDAGTGPEVKAGDTIEFEAPTGRMIQVEILSAQPPTG